MGVRRRGWWITVRAAAPPKPKIKGKIKVEIEAGNRNATERYKQWEDALLLQPKTKRRMAADALDRVRAADLSTDRAPPPPPPGKALRILFPEKYEERRGGRARSIIHSTGATVYFHQCVFRAFFHHLAFKNLLVCGLSGFTPSRGQRGKIRVLMLGWFASACLKCFGCSYFIFSIKTTLHHFSKTPSVLTLFFQIARASTFK